MSAQVSRLSTTLSGLTNPLRIVHLSDLHYGLYVGPGMVAGWAAQTLELSPDLVVMTGDFVDRLAWRGLGGLRRGLEPLHAPLGVYGVWGNHDHARGRTRVLGPLLEDLGICLVNNRGVLVRDDLFLAGIDDFGRGQPEVNGALAGRPPGTACILLSHNPDALPEVPLEIDLVLSGHTHGGQIKLPLVGALRTSSDYGQRFLEGWIREPGLPLAYVSRGLGTTMLPLRWNSPAEIVRFECKPTG